MTTFDRTDFEMRLAALEAISRAQLRQMEARRGTGRYAAYPFAPPQSSTTETTLAHYRARLEAFRDVHRILKEMEEDEAVQRSLQAAALADAQTVHGIVVSGIKDLVSARGGHA